MGYDIKYGQVTTEHGTIGADEPVFVLRAQDGLSLGLLADYHRLCTVHGSPQHHLDGIETVINTFAAWQTTNFTKIPESA